MDQTELTTKTKC